MQSQIGREGVGAGGARRRAAANSDGGEGKEGSNAGGGAVTQQTYAHKRKLKAVKCLDLHLDSLGVPSSRQRSSLEGSNAR